MFRFSAVLLVGLWVASPSLAGWADGLFDELSRDFGSVPRGPTLTHHFRVKNNTGGPVQITGVRVSCGCVTATALKNDLQPGEETSIQALMDTRRFTGPKTVTIYVTIGQPRFDEVRLWVTANGRDDVNVSPDSLAFGQVRRGANSAAAVKVTLSGYLGAYITEAKCETNYIQAAFKEVTRADSSVVYELTATIRSDAPVGRWYTDVWLTTNITSMPKVRVPLTVEIGSPLTVSPAQVVLGGVKVGAETERRVIVRGSEPFTIKEILGAPEGVTVKDTTEGAKAVHVLSVRAKGARAGEWLGKLRVVTDLKQDPTVEFEAKVQVVP